MRRRRRRRARLCDLAKSLLAFLFSNVGVVVLVFAYTVAGAFMFQAIEGASELEREYNMTTERDKTAQNLWNITLKLTFNESASKERISFELLEYQSKIVGESRRGWHGSPRRWTFSSAFLYSLTVITTIGYGHLSPHTKWGKVITIFYALLGMPLFLLYLANVGELLARWFKCLYALVCLCRGCPGFRRRVPRLPGPVDVSEVESIERPEAWRAPYFESHESFDRIHPYSRHYPLPSIYDRVPEYGRSYSSPAPRAPAASLPPPLPPHAASEPRHVSHWDEQSDFTYVTFDAQTITVPVSVCIFILVGYIIFGSMIFGIWEKWDQLDGAYFCFISLSSIGFGDFVPGERVMTPRIETSFIVCSLYLMLGMALVAMCFNLMQEQVIHYFAGMKRALKRLCRCKR